MYQILQLQSNRFEYSMHNNDGHKRVLVYTCVIYNSEIFDDEMKFLTYMLVDHGWSHCTKTPTIKLHLRGSTVDFVRNCKES